MVIAKISATSAQPYYSGLKAFGPFIPFPVGSGVLADLMMRGKVLAGPVNALEYVKLCREGCVPLSDFGLFLNPYVVNKIDTSAASGARAALLHAPFVLLARKPLEQFEDLKVGVSPEAVSSGSEALILAKLLLSFHWELSHELNGEMSMEDDAWLVPGGPYLQVNSRAFFGMPYAYDLAWEWQRWQKTPFIFYRWVCTPDMEPEMRENLIVALRRALENNLRNLPILAGHEAGARGLERHEVLTYLQGFGYRLGLWERQSQASLERVIPLLKERELQAFNS